MAKVGPMSVRPVPAYRLWLLVLGFGAWCSALITVYALHSVGCTFAWSANMLRLCLALQLPFLKISESMGNHDLKSVGAGSVD